ncbi:DUF6882 domain-containing protein [Nocardia aurea]|uniref:DUF6882 domain-containing protein n=1 Tax=Nocardia aurea TaxID=2144174 RepID=A0ABV3FMR0_9NOCA
MLGAPHGPLEVGLSRLGRPPLGCGRGGNEMSDVTLANLLDDAAFLSLEHQLHLVDVTGDRGWQVDLKGQGRFTFTGDEPIVADRVNLLGSAAPGPRSWLWAWANPAGYPEAVTGLAASLRDFGTQHGIQELTQPEVPFGALPGGSDDPVVVVSLFMEVAKAVSGLWTSYNGPVGGGTRAGFVIEHPSFQLSTPVGPRIATVLQQGSMMPTLSDHRRAIHSYASKRGLGLQWNTDWSQAVITAPGIRATVEFDGYARIEKINIEM